METNIRAVCVLQLITAVLVAVGAGYFGFAQQQTETIHDEFVKDAKLLAENVRSGALSPAQLEAVAILIERAPGDLDFQRQVERSLAQGLAALAVFLMFLPFILWRASRGRANRSGA